MKIRKATIDDAKAIAKSTLKAGKRHMKESFHPLIYSS
jgi:hypothetical protein